VIKSILLALDGSTHARHAQAVAIDLASKYQASLTLVHVLTNDHPPNAFARMAEVEHMSESKKPRVGEKADTYATVARFLGSSSDSKEARIIVLLGEQIVESASKSARKAGVKNVTAEIRTGDYANNILEVAKKTDADMIVMGRRGLNKLKGFVMGSVSHKVSQRADCSVLTVK